MTSTASELLVSVVMPAYNVAWCIGRAVDSVLAQDFHRRELIVVNDGSKDRTGEIVAHLSASEPRVRLINHPVNKGYGAALVTGFESVSKEMAFFMDSDGQFDIKDLSELLRLKLVKNNDTVEPVHELRRKSASGCF